MFCGSCGTKNPDVNKFCRECGAKLPDRANRTLSEDQFADLRPPTPSPPVDNAKVAVLMDVAFSYHREGKVDEAIDTCLKAVALNPSSTTAHSLLALLYEERGQFDLAVTHLQRVLDLNPESVVDQDRLARLLGDAPPQMQQAGARKPAASALASLAQHRPLAISVGAGLIVLFGLLAAAAPFLKGSSGPSTARRPEQPVPPSPYRSLGEAIRERQTTGVAGPTPAAQPVPGEPQVAVGEDMVPPPPPPRSLSTPLPAPEAAVAPATPPRQPPTLPGEDQVEPLPPPERRRPAAPPVIYLPPRERTQQAASVRGTPSPRPAGPVAMDITLEPGPTPAPMRAETAPERSASAPAPPAPATSGPRATIKVHDATPADYQEWALNAQASGDYEKALSSFRKALDGARSSQDRGRIHQHMAYAYQQLGRNDDAESAYRRAISEYEDQLRQGAQESQIRMSIRACQDGLRTLNQ